MNSTDRLPLRDRNPLFLIVLALLMLTAPACKRRSADDFAAMAAALDTNPDAPMAASRADSLITIYRFAVEADSAADSVNLRYLTRAAELQHRYNHDVVKATDWLLTALDAHGQGQDVTPTVALLARMRSYDLHNQGQTGKLDSAQLTALDRHLTAHTPEMEARLAQLNKTMGGEMVRDTAAGRLFMETAAGYALALLPSDTTKAAKLLEQAAGVAKMLNDQEKSLTFYRVVADRMATHKKAATSLFLIGFTYENELNDTASARKAYEQFLARYPNDDLADDVQNLLQNLGRSPEELLKEIQKNTAQSARKKKKRK